MGNSEVRFSGNRDPRLAAEAPVLASAMSSTSSLTADSGMLYIEILKMEIGSKA